MADSIELLQKLQQDISALMLRLARIEEETSSTALAQVQIAASVRELQGTVLKARIALNKVKERLG